MNNELFWLILYDTVKSKNRNFWYISSSLYPPFPPTSTWTPFHPSFLSPFLPSFLPPSLPPSLLTLPSHPPSLPPSSLPSSFHTLFTSYLPSIISICPQYVVTIILTYFTYSSLLTLTPLLYSLLTTYPLCSVLCFLFANLIYILLRYLVQKSHNIVPHIVTHPSVRTLLNPFICAYVRSSIAEQIEIYKYRLNCFLTIVRL